VLARDGLALQGAITSLSRRGVLPHDANRRALYDFILLLIGGTAI
jgi:hypothetical protein